VEDPFDGIVIENGRLKLPEGPGSGVSLRETEEVRGRKPAPVAS